MQRSRASGGRCFNEPELNALEEQLDINNQNIAEYFQNFMAARDLVREARAGYYPTVTTDPSFSRQRTPSTLRNTGVATGTGTTGTVSIERLDFDSAFAAD